VLVRLLELQIDRIKAAVDLVEAAVDLVEAAVDLVEATFDLVEATLNSVETTADLVEFGFRVRSERGQPELDLADAIVQPVDALRQRRLRSGRGLATRWPVDGLR